MATAMRRLPSLTALRAYEAAARHASVQAAAAELSVTPTAVSHQVRLLEEELGVALFTRTPRQLVLTPKGQELLSGLSNAFDAMAQTVARVRQPLERQTITLSSTPAVAVRWLLPRLPALQTAAPTLDLRLVISHRWAELDGVQADMAIRYGDGHWPGLTAHHLLDNDFVPVCSPRLGLTQASDLPRHTLLHFEPTALKARTTWRKEWADWQQLAGVDGLDVGAGPVFSDETHAISAALAGQGVALMSRRLVEPELMSGTLVAPFGPVLPGQPFYLVYPTQRETEGPINAVRQWLLEDA